MSTGSQAGYQVLLVTTSQEIWVRLRLLLKTRGGLVYLVSLPCYIDIVVGAAQAAQTAQPLELLDHLERQSWDPACPVIFLLGLVMSCEQCPGISFALGQFSWERIAPGNHGPGKVSMERM